MSQAMNNEKIGIDRYASFDPSISRTRIAAHVHTPGYLGALIYCLRHSDNEAAELIRNRNEVHPAIAELAEQMDTATEAILSDLNGKADEAVAEALEYLDEPKVEVPDLEEAERIKRTQRRVA